MANTIKKVMPSLLLMTMMATALAASTHEMQAAVDRLVAAARQQTMLWPWHGPLPEVDEVAAYGKPIAPLLVQRLADDPDRIDDNPPMVDWYVQQQLALALCRIYGVEESAGHVYSNRAMPEENARIKQFWRNKLKPSHSDEP